MATAGSGDRARYATLQRAVQTVGFIRRGSLVRRFMPCGKPGCACQGTPPALHGPYFQWTRKVRGTTVTVRLTRPQARRVAQWIANGRQLDRLVAQMEALSLRVTTRLLTQLPPPAARPTGPARRPRRRRTRRRGPVRAA